MTGILQPLDNKFAIADARGNPTDYFIRWAQQKQIDIGSSITLTDLANYLAAHKLASGQGIALTPDGNLADSPSISVLNGTGLDFDVMHNLKLADTAVVPGTYGDATHVPAIVVDQQGRITGVTLIAVSGGGGGGVSAIGYPLLSATQTPGVNNYIMTFMVVDTAITVNKVAFVVNAATATSKLQAFVYASNAAGVAGALLGSSAQQTGVVAGYNEIALTAPVVLTKGTLIWIGVNVTVAALAGMYARPGGLSAFAGNGGSTVPANPSPAITTFTTANAIYAIWGVT